MSLLKRSIQIERNGARGTARAYGLSNASKQVIQPEKVSPTTSAETRWTPQVDKGLSFTGGKRRPRRRTTGVARAHGIHATTMVKNSFIQAWCMPSERMTKTVCVASKSPRASQIEAIHSHGDCSRTGDAASSSNPVLGFTSI
jgi:hypothetical protein